MVILVKDFRETETTMAIEWLRVDQRVTLILMVILMVINLRQDRRCLLEDHAVTMGLGTILIPLYMVTMATLCTETKKEKIIIRRTTHLLRGQALEVATELNPGLILQIPVAKLVLLKDFNNHRRRRSPISASSMVLVGLEGRRKASIIETILR